ncbi:MAG: lipid-A-disaccharide synthase N-terminal domain-containing protein, partial [Gammaproteobacteria bacterium]|nr:lipid-A-disaccharide synthase N-terminal domain-containing protein [Gammaproteobacteria bacterium]
MHWGDLLWLGIGLVAQFFFAARFLSQWLFSERAGRSLMPVHFWYLSVAGS